MALEVELERLKSPVLDIPLPTVGADPHVVVVGDIHGQLPDVLHIFKTRGLPSQSVVYLFNGDIADRGRFAVEVWLLLAAFQLDNPGSVYVLRGNHENEQMNARPFRHGGGFEEECLQKYGTGVREAFRRLFMVLPLFAVVGEEVFVVHGGLFRRPSAKLSRLRSLPASAWRRSYPDPRRHAQWSEEEEIIFDAQWADPHDGQGSLPSKRGGPAMTFGVDVTHRFLDEAGLALCIRSHRVPENHMGYELRHGGRLMTVFSASDYGGVVGNRGAVALLRAAGSPAPHALAAAAGTEPMPPLRKLRLSVVEHDLIRGLVDGAERFLEPADANQA